MKIFKKYTYLTLFLIGLMSFGACSVQSAGLHNSETVNDERRNVFFYNDERVFYKDYNLNNEINFAKIISVSSSIDNSWNPLNKLDFPRNAPKSWDLYKESVNSYTFASNTAIMLGTSMQPRGKNIAPLLSEMADALDKIASDTSIETPNGGLQVYNKFSYSQKAGPNYSDVTIPAGFGSAFSNAFFANGYLNLYQMTNKAEYLEKAHKYLLGIIDKDAKNKLYTIYDGYIWYEMISSDSVNMRPYNGHIAVIASMLNFEKLTKSHEFDEFIKAGIFTMEKNLNAQIRPKGFFGYMPENPDLPDYGQERALNYSIFLCDLTKDRSLCHTSDMFKFYSDLWSKQANSKDAAANN